MILSYHAVPTEEEMFFIGSTLRCKHIVTELFLFCSFNFPFAVVK